MRVKKQFLRIVSTLLITVLVVGMCPLDWVRISWNTAEAASSSSLEATKEVSLVDMPNNIVRNYFINLLGITTGKLTYSDMLNYTGEVVLPVGIKNIEGVGLARSATKIDISGADITEINDSEFNLCTGPIEIKIPTKVTTIKSNAFNGCTNLANINIENVTRIEANAFNGCSKLNNITLHSQIALIGQSAFQSCTSLQSIEINNAAVQLLSDVFKGCINLVSVKLPDELTEIPNGFLQDTMRLKNFLPPSKLKRIGSYAFASSMQLTEDGYKVFDFERCTSLEVIDNSAFQGAGCVTLLLPDCVTTIGALAFNASSLRSFELPQNLISIGNRAFVACKYLESITINSKLPLLSEYMFDACEGLMEVNVEPNSQITKVSAYAFSRCYSLKDNKFLNNFPLLTEIGEFAFYGCIAEVLDSKGNNVKDMYGDNLYIGELTEVIIPDTVTTLGIGVFSECRTLKTAIIGKGITELPKNTFKDCNELFEVQLPDTMHSIGDNAFQKCYRLTQITLPPELISIGKESFQACGRYVSVKRVPATQYVMSESRISNVPSLEKVRIYYTKEQERAYPVLDKTTGNLMDSMVNAKEIRLYQGYVDQNDLGVVSEDGTEVYAIDYNQDYYTTNSYELQGLQHIVIPESVTIIGDRAFDSCVALQSVKLPELLEKLPNDIFKNCGIAIKDTTGKPIPVHYYGIEDINLPSALKEIGSYAFYNCANLTLEDKITGKVGRLPQYLKSIGSYAFSGCLGLTTIQVNSELESIGSRAFENCGYIGQADRIGQNESGDEVRDNGYKVLVTDSYGLRTFDTNLATSLTSIGEAAFSYTPLGSIVLQNITEVKANTFLGCEYLTRAQLAEATNYIGKYSFKDCRSLEDVKLPASAVVEATAFTGYINPSFNWTLYSEPSVLSVAYNSEITVPIFLNNIAIQNHSGIMPSFINGEGKLAVDVSQTEVMKRGSFSVTVNKIILKGMEETLPNDPVKIEFTNNFRFANKYCANRSFNKTVTYDVHVVQTPCTGVSFMDSFYVISRKNANPITMEAILEPTNTTQKIEWSNDNQDIVNLCPNQKPDITVPNPEPGVEYTTNDKTAKITRVDETKLGISKVRIDIGDQSAVANVYVVSPARSVTLNISEINLYLGLSETAKIDATCNYDSTENAYKVDYPDILRFTSSNNEVVEVDQEGNLQAKGMGTATITVKALGGNVSRTCKVTVSPNNTLITLKNPSIAIGADGVYEIPAKTNLVFDIVRNPVESISAMEINVADTTAIKASFSKTTTKDTVSIMGYKPGEYEVYILAKNCTDLEKYAAKIKVRVLADVTSITLLANSTIYLDKTQQIVKSIGTVCGSVTKVADLSNVSSNTITFQSMDPTVATVDKSGLVKPIKPGKTTIKAICKGKNNLVTYEKQTDVIVAIPPATSVKIEGQSLVSVGGSITLKASLTPIQAVNKVTFEPYSSMDALLISVNSTTGVVKGIKPGTARIRAITDNGKYTTFYITVIQKVQSFKVLKPAINIKVGYSYQIGTRDYQVVPSTATEKIVEWVSANQTIAKVSSTGRVTAVKIGKTTITAKTQTGLKVSFVINVINPATRITLPYTASVNKGKTITLKKTITPSNAIDTYKWTTSNSKIATVSSTGVVKGTGKGTATITVTSSSGIKAICRVTVNVPSTKVEIKTTYASNKKIYLVQGKRYSLYTSITPSDSTDKLTWSSSKTKYVRVSNGVLTAVKKGTSTITVKTSSGKKDTITVVVVSKTSNASKVKIPSSKTVKKGKTLQLTATVSSSSSTSTLTWSSSNSKIAKVDRFGKVTGLKKGTVTITVRTSSGKTAKCKVKVS